MRDGRDGAVDVSVVLPVFRNRETLVELHARLSQTLAPASLRYELLFVDDASPDGAGDAIRDLATRDPRVRAIHLPRNVGQHRAAWLGLQASRGAWVVVMDADLQDPPEAIPALLAAATPRTEAVFATRRGRYEGPGRLFTSRLFKSVRHLLTGVPRDAGMFLALRRSLVEEILRIDVPRPFLTAMVGILGRPYVTVPVERSRRPCGTSAYGPGGRLLTGSSELAFVLRHRGRLRDRRSV